MCRTNGQLGHFLWTPHHGVGEDEKERVLKKHEKKGGGRKEGILLNRD